MAFLGQSGLTALWNKIKSNFGVSLSVSGTTVQLKNGAATPAVLSQATIPTATASAAGVVMLGTTSGTAAAGDHTHAGYVPTARTVNGKALSSDVSLTASDVGAMSKADVDSAIAAAQAGAAVYQGAAAKESDIGGTAYKQGWYWVVSAAGTYCGEVCEPGDMVFCNKDKGGAFSASDFDVVQANIQELTASEVEALLV